MLPEPGDLSPRPRNVVVRLGFKQPLRPISAVHMLTHTGPTTGEYIPYQWLGAKEERLSLHPQTDYLSSPQSSQQSGWLIQRYSSASEPVRTENSLQGQVQKARVCTDSCYSKGGVARASYLHLLSPLGLARCRAAP